MSDKLKKYDLPLIKELDHVKIDPQELKQYTSDLHDQFTDVKTTNKSLCAVHEKLVKDVYENFHQISLTTLRPDVSTDIKIDDTGSKSNEVKDRLKKAKAGTSINEHLYDYRTDLIDERIDKILNQFKSKVSRVRLVKLDPNTSIPPHIDYDPSYATRIIVPVIAPKACVNVFWYKKEVKSFYLEEGKAYFLNTGFKHAVMNWSNEPRITFMLSLDGQDDIK
jgi:hypothetical protein